MKKKVFYEVNEVDLCVNEDVVESYGIDCTLGGRKIASVSDISTDREHVERLAKLCNELGLDPSQLEDVAEDWA
jgi:hypothetical protein